MLKSDFHMHSKEDWYDCHHISYSDKDVIREAARQKFEVLSLTHHNHVHFSEALKSYAKTKGILLIPGAEIRLSGKDVLLVNVTNDDLKKIKTFKDLKKIHEKAVVVAPHPYFVLDACLGDLLEENINLFHAIEYCHFYSRLMTKEPLRRWINGNEKAIRVAEKHNLPMIGTSDMHRMYELGTTFSWVDSEKKIDPIIDAIKKGKIEVDTKPMSGYHFTRRLVSATTKEKWFAAINRVKNVPDIPDEPFFKKFK